MSNATTSNQAMVEQPSATPKTAPKGMMWTGRTLSGLTVLFMLFDASLVEQFAQMGAHRLSGRSMEKFRYVGIDKLHNREYLKGSVL